MYYFRVKRGSETMIKILFIGNSHTYFNDMVQRFVETCNENGTEVHVAMLAHGGKGLLWHSEEPEVRFNILYGGYDYVVLQDAAHPFGGEENLLKGVKKIQEFINQVTAKTVLYMTWAEKEFPKNQEAMSLAYKAVAKKTNALLAPVGDYWKEMLIQRPDTAIFSTDGQHASPKGSLLASQIIYLTLFEGLSTNAFLESLDSLLSK